MSASPASLRGGTVDGSDHLQDLVASRPSAPVLLRQRLVTRLDRFTAAQITEVVGPVGAGKSTLVTSWAAEHDVVWLAAGRHHRLLVELLRHHGLEATSVDEEGAVAALRDLPSDRDAALVVVDDAHYLPEDVVRGITRLATEAPQAARFVLVGREVVTFPELPFEVAVSTLPASELRFTDEEARGLVLALAPTVDDRTLDRIVRDGGGWAAALVVSARTFGDEAEALPQPPATGRLSTQVLAAVPDAVSALLLATCDEKEFAADIAVSLTGNTSVPGLLQKLADDGLLVQRLEDTTESYCMNEVLRLALRKATTVGEAGHETRAQAHLRAATMLVHSRAELELAVRHAVLSEDAQVLLRVLRMHGHGLIDGNGWALLADALEALPRELRASDPTVLVLEALLCRMTLRYEEAADLSLAAERASEIDSVHHEGEVDHLTLDMIDLMRLWRSRCGWADPVAAVTAARERMGCQHDVSRGTHRMVPGRSLAWSTWLLGELATVEIRVGYLDEAGVHLRELIHNGHVLGHDRMLAVGFAHRALLEMLDGSFQTAVATARSSLAHTEWAGLRGRPHIALAHLVSGWGALHRLDLADCEEHLIAAEREGAIEVDVLVSELDRLLRARLLAERGQVEEASILLAEHRSAEWGVPAFMRRLSLIVEAQTAALVNDAATVRDRSLALAELGYEHEAELFGAVADAFDGHVAQALARIDDLLGQPRLDALLGALAAATHVGLLLLLGESGRAAERLPDLLTRVASQRLLQILTIGFLGGAGFADLLAAEARRPDGHPFAVEALGSLACYASAPGQGSPRMWAVRSALRSVAAAGDTEVATSAVALTRRETEVLAELANGGSYADVAEALFVSENTVKTHLASVYRKLGVDRRGDALKLARAQRLI